MKYLLYVLSLYVMPLWCSVVECQEWPGPYITAAYLYWQPSFEQTDLAILAHIEGNTGDREFLHLKPLEYPFDSGFQIGLGYNVPCLDWELFVNWTWLQSTPFISVSANEEYVLYPVGAFEQILASHVKGKGHIGLNVVDLELGKEWNFDCGLSFRPFYGVKGVWLNYSFACQFFDPTSASPGNVVSDVKTFGHDHIYGVGPRIGLNTRWGSNIALLFDGAIALVWESFRPQLGLTYVLDDAPHGGAIASHPHTIQTILELFFGVGYETVVSDRCLFAASVGYQMQYWTNQIPGSFLDTNFNQAFNLQGLTASLACHF